MNENDFNATPPQGQSSYQYGDSASQPRQQSGQTPFQDPNAGQQTSSYQPYAGSVPPSGPGSMPPVGPQVYYAPAPNQKWNTLCIIGFVLSFLMPVIGLVLSVVALVQINRSGEKSKGMSIAGIVIGAVRTVLNIIIIIVFVSAFGYAINHSDTDDQSCHGSDCSSDPYDDDDGDDPDDDNEDTDYAYYLYDSSQGSPITNMSTLPTAA